jgi:hypothetical protein
MPRRREVLLIISAVARCALLDTAVELLTAYGLVDPAGRGGTWTAASEALMND